MATEPDDDTAEYIAMLITSGKPRWHQRANCKDMDPTTFFPARGESLEPAKQVCRGCTVREECLEYALTTGERFGVWGGISERERRGMRAARGRAKRDAAARTSAA